MKRYIKVVSIVIAAAILMSSAGCAMAAKERAEGGATESITRQTAADASGCQYFCAAFGIGAKGIGKQGCRK